MVTGVFNPILPANPFFEEERLRRQAILEAARRQGPLGFGVVGPPTLTQDIASGAAARPTPVLDALKRGLIGDDPLSSPLLAIGSSLLASSGPSTTPQNLGGALGLALQQGGAARQLEILNALRQQQSAVAQRNAATQERTAAVAERNVAAREQAAAAPSEQFEVLSPQEVTNVGLPPGTFAQRSTTTGRILPGRTPSGLKFRVGPDGTVEAATGTAELTELTAPEERQLRQTRRSADAAIGTLGKAITDVENTPGAFGVRGFIADRVGSGLRILDEVFQTDTAGALTEAVTGADEQKVAEVRTNAKFLASQMLSAITAEESGRFTDVERQIANETLRALEATENPETIKGALGVALRTQLISDDRAARELGQSPSLPVETAEGINQIRKDLKAKGISDDVIKSIILERRRQLGLTGSQ